MNESCTSIALAALSQVLGSKCFARAERRRRLLKYVTEETLAGRASVMKEYSIGLEVFDKPASYDPREDSTVRTEVNKLRMKLREYYATEGREDPLILTIPTGGYQVVFERRQPEAVVSGDRSVPQQTAEPPRRDTRVILRGLGVAVLVLAVAAGLWLSYRFWSSKSSGGSPEVSGLRRITAGTELAAYPALAGSGRWFVYSSDRGEGTFLNLWKQSLKGGEPERLTRAEKDDIDSSISPDERWIAFQSGRDRFSTIRLIGAGGGPERLIDHFGRSPRFSPDGKWLTYWKQDPHTSFGTVFVAALTELIEPKRIAREFEDAHYPVWTPDGKHILFCGTRASSGGPAHDHDFWVVSVDGTETFKTGAMAVLRRNRLTPHVVSLRATTLQWFRSGVLFAGVAGDNVQLFHLPLSRRWEATGGLKQLTQDTNGTPHVSAQGGSLLFSSVRSNVDVWSATLDERSGAVGDPHRLTRHPADDLSPSISQDGRTAVFLSRRTGTLNVWRMDVVTGRETQITSLPAGTNRLKISADGKAAFYRVLEGEGVQRQAIYAVDLETARVGRVCTDCGAPTHVTSDGRQVIFETGSQLARLGAVQIETGQKAEFMAHSHHALRAARVSPDNEWIAFQMDRGLDGKQLYVAPFRRGAPVPESLWVAITPATGAHQEPWWSPDGQKLYYLSDADGWRCVWSQTFDRATGRGGTARPVLHFHGASRMPLSLLPMDPLYVGLSVSKDRILLSMVETAGDVWIANLR